MSSPVQNDQDNDDQHKSAMRAPPWARDEWPDDDDDAERIRAEIAAAAARRRTASAKSSPQPRGDATETAARAQPSQQFDLDDAIRDAWAASSRRDPVQRPPERKGPSWGWLPRFMGAASVAAIVALFVSGVVPHPSISVSFSRPDKAASSAEPTETRRESARQVAVQPVNAAPQASPVVARPAVAPPPPPAWTVSPSVAASFAAQRPEAPRASHGSDVTRRDDIEQLLKRGHDLLANGDVSGGRQLLLRAAEAGDPQASFALGASYDPVMMGYLGIVGVPPDPAKARAWYTKAAEQGSPEAARRLERLASR